MELRFTFQFLSKAIAPGCQSIASCCGSYGPELEAAAALALLGGASQAKKLYPGCCLRELQSRRQFLSHLSCIATFITPVLSSFIFQFMILRGIC
jgi:hypothetical protein